jgi:hypothetical protein
MKQTELSFHIEKRDGVSVVVFKEGGCHPATTTEIELWKALHESKKRV